MKILRKFGEEIVPLSTQQGISLLVFVVVLFQFALFYGPVLADYAVKQAQAAPIEEEMVSLGTITKGEAMDQEAAKVMDADETSANFTSQVKAIETEESVASSTPQVRVIRTSVHKMTAYNSEAAQTDASPCITANGFNVCEHGVEDTIAANFLKFGTKVQIPELFGDRVFVVRDRMNSRYGDRVDIWMKDRSDALNFGIKTAMIQVVEIN